MSKQKSFKIIEENSARTILMADIRILFEIMPVQSLTEGGLALSLIFINDSGTDKEVLNPLDYLKITMQDEQGWPVQLPVTQPRVQIDAVGEVEILRPYKVELFQNSLSESNLIEEVGNKNILMKAGVTYTIRIRIDNVQDTNKERSMLRTTITRPISKGKYKINIRLALMFADGSLYRQSESGYEDVELV